MFKRNCPAKAFKWLSASIMLMLYSLTTAAAPVSITGNGFTVTYDPALIDPLFGVPKLAGDVIYFTPSRFRAQAGNGQSIAISSATAANILITKKICCKNLRGNLRSINLYASGDYQVLNGNALNFVGLSGELRAFEGGPGIGADLNGTQTAAALVFVAGTALNPTSSYVAAPWAAAATIGDGTSTIDGSNPGWLGSAAYITVTMNNILSANSVGSIADIENFYISLTLDFGNNSPVKHPKPLGPALSH
ncbi:MAG: hypothetical protein WCA64_05725 [Gallionella sp.]